MRTSLIRSAIGWRSPNGPARFGPYRSCIRPSAFRSSQVVYANATITRLITRNDSISAIHHTSAGWVTCFTSTVGWRSPASGRAIRTVPASRSCAIRARSATLVPFELTVTVSPGAIPRERASARASSTSPPSRWYSSSGVRSTAGPEKSGR